MLLAIFGFLMAWFNDSSWFVWIIGFLCLYADLRNPNPIVSFLALFGFFTAIHYESPFYVWIVGFLCLYFDSKENRRISKSVG